MIYISTFNQCCPWIFNQTKLLIKVYPLFWRKWNNTNVQLQEKGKCLWLLLLVFKQMYPPLLPSQLIWNIFCLFYRCVFVLSISWAFNRHSALLQSDGSIMLAWSLNTHVSKSLSNPRACMWPHRFHTRLCSYLQSTPELLPHHTQLHFHVFFSTSVCVLPCPLCSSSKGTGTAVRVWGQTFSRSAAILCCQRLSESGHPRPAHQRKCLSDQDIFLLKVAH